MKISNTTLHPTQLHSFVIISLGVAGNICGGSLNFLIRIL
jgi:hypothetical protein